MKKKAQLAFIICWLLSYEAQAQGQRTQVPRLKMQQPQTAVGQPTVAKTRRPPIVLHVIRNMPAIRPLITGASHDAVNDPNALYSDSALTIIRKKSTPQGLDISFTGPPDTTPYNDNLFSDHGELPGYIQPTGDSTEPVAAVVSSPQDPEVHDAGNYYDPLDVWDHQGYSQPGWQGNPVPTSEQDSWLLR